MSDLLEDSTEQSGRVANPPASRETPSQIFVRRSILTRGFSLSSSGSSNFKIIFRIGNDRFFLHPFQQLHIHNLKSTSFWDITLCSSLKVNSRLGEKNLFHLHSRAWKWNRYIPPKRRLTFNGLHGVMYQNIVLIIITGVIASSPTYHHLMVYILTYTHTRINSETSSFVLDPLVSSPSTLIWSYGSYSPLEVLIRKMITHVAKPLPRQGNSSLEWDSNRIAQCLSGRKYFMP
jgi:hypothetical protein